MRHLVVSYDVVDDARRARLAKFLTGHLDRVQKSVFEGAVEDPALERLRQGITKRIDRSVDSVRIYGICARCLAAVEIIGSGVYIDDERPDIVV
jgi:CRISPR-associated protein Cas2